MPSYAHFDLRSHAETAWLRGVGLVTNVGRGTRRAHPVHTRALMANPVNTARPSGLPPFSDAVLRISLKISSRVIIP